MTALMKNVVNHWKSPPSPVELCDICGRKPKFIERGFKHPYCSRTCAAKSGQGANLTICLLDSCRLTGKPAYTGYCSDTHGREAVRRGQAKACEDCRVEPQRNGDLCLTCERKGAQAGVRLRELSKTGNTFKQVKVQFASEWESTTKGPSHVEKIYEVVNPRDVRLRYSTYKARQVSPIEIRAFHSSQCICDLGTKEGICCNFQSCGICSVVTSSFKSFAFGAPYNNGRFGDGIYLYRNPALADKFATSCTSSPYRVGIAADVILEANIEISDVESIFIPGSEAVLPAYVIVYCE